MNVGLILAAIWFVATCINLILMLWKGEDGPVNRKHWQSYVLYLLLSPITLCETINSSLVEWNHWGSMTSEINSALRDSLEDTEYEDISQEVYIALVTYYANHPEQVLETSYELCSYCEKIGLLYRDNGEWRINENFETEN